MDPATGEYGVAVQSHWFNVGRSAAWVRFGAGTVATQALTDPSYGFRGLDIMAAGVDAATTLRLLLDADPHRDRRQVAIVDQSGGSAVHTGAGCVAHASHIAGEGWSVQGNLLRAPGVVEAMAESFERSTGALADRMVGALRAAEQAGGDLRGSQSAAIRVVPGRRDLAGGQEAGVDILIADHPDPIAELERLVEVDQAYRALRRGGTAVDSGDRSEAIRQYELAASLRHGPEVDFWQALGRLRLGCEQEQVAIDQLRTVFAVAPPFEEVLGRLAPIDETAELAVRLLAAAEIRWTSER
jgi:uncharacterized Ntn-hydrolase superfamily protein